MSSFNDGKDDDKSKEDLPKGIKEQLHLLTGSTVSLDPDGDLTLLVGSGDKMATFCVSSKVMRLTSPVWQGMLRSDYGTYFSEHFQGHAETVYNPFR